MMLQYGSVIAREADDIQRYDGTKYIFNFATSFTWKSYLAGIILLVTMQENLIRVTSITDSYTHEAKVSFKPERNNQYVTGFSYYEKFDERGKVLNMSENAQYICYLTIGEK